MSQSGVTVTVAKAVETLIAAKVQRTDGYLLSRRYATWDLSLTTGNFELSDANKLHIDVVSHTTETEVTASTSGSLAYLTVIDVAVRYKFQPSDSSGATGEILTEQIDDLVTLVEEIHLPFFNNTFTDNQLAIAWRSTKVLVCPNNDHLRLMRQFTGIVRMTFRSVVHRAPAS